LPCLAAGFLSFFFVGRSFEGFILAMGAYLDVERLRGGSPFRCVGSRTRSSRLLPECLERRHGGRPLFPFFGHPERFQTGGHGRRGVALANERFLPGVASETLRSLARGDSGPR
jgi:hypothetical protein